MRKTYIVAIAASLMLATAPAFAESGTTLGGGGATQKTGGGNKTSSGSEKSGGASTNNSKTDQGTGTTLAGGQKGTK